jgi:hypothetical protein
MGQRSRCAPSQKNVRKDLLLKIPVDNCAQLGTSPRMLYLPSFGPCSPVPLFSGF